MSRFDVVTVGETLVAFTMTSNLRVGATALADIAGSESNVAIGLARMGHDVRWVSRLGDDHAGRLVSETLHSERVEVAAPLVPGGETGVLMSDVGPWGRRRVGYSRSASPAAALGPGDLDRVLEKPARYLYVSGVTAALSSSAALLVASALSDARDAGWRTCLDVNYRSRLWSREEASTALRGVLGSVDVLVASEDELPLVAVGALEEDQVTDVLSRVSMLALKRGAKGATIFAPSGRWDRSALAVPVVSPIGAGDAFTGGLLSGLLDDLSPEQVLDRAVRVGAAAVSCASDWQGLPRRDELMSLDETVDVGEVKR